MGTGTPYEGGIYELSIQCPDNYPYDPPKIRFLTKIYHAHLCDGEDIKLNLMENNWSPHFKLTQILYAIVECMSAGFDESDALVASAAVEMRQNMQRFLRIAVEMNHKHAGGESIRGRGLEALEAKNTLHLTYSIQNVVAECIYGYYGISCADLLALCICQFYESFPNFEPWMEYSLNLKAKGKCIATRFTSDDLLDNKVEKGIQVRISIQGQGDTSFPFRVSPYHRVLALKKRLKMEYGIDVSGMILEYHGCHLQDDDVVGDRGKALEKMLIFKPVAKRNVH